MLTEDMRIIAGLQESRQVDNPLPMLLEIEKQEKIQRINRDLNSKKNVTTHFETFKENIKERNTQQSQKKRAKFSNNGDLGHAQLGGIIP